MTPPAPDDSIDERDASPALRIQLEAEAGERERDRRAREIHARYVPRLRVIGSFIISAWLYLHLRFIDSGDVSLWWFPTVILFAHTLIAWIVLDRFYHRRAKYDLALLFLTTDVVLWTYIVYVTGAEQSWMFILLSVRSADQSPTTFRRTLYFAHLGTFLYLLMLVLTSAQTPIDWPEGLTKASIIYGFNLYLSLAARTTEANRRRMSAAIRMARESITNLDEKRQELTDALTKTAELERSLAQSQKLESLGQMASGIAHDFNNTMMSALPWTDVIARQYPADPVLQRAAAQIRTAVLRARDVTSHLLDFAQPKPPRVEAVDIGKLLRQELDVLRLSIPEDIRIDVTEPAQPCLAEVDSSQFAQVVINLTLNARDAMPDGGILSFTLRDAEIHELGHDNVSPATHVAIDITDTGEGMDAATASRAFDPFFTTKPFGRGSGLGLSVVHRTVQQSGGAIAVRSRPGHGSTFTILLRRGEPVPERPSTSTDGAAEFEYVAEWKILVVDDDPGVVEGLRMMLEMENAKVSVRTSGPAALELLAGGFRPDVIILDFGMPAMSGAEVHAEIRRRGLTIPIVISSGYGDSERLRRVLSDGRTLYLQKPYELNDLLETIAEAFALR